jgi:hypothetical protein
VAGDDVTKQDAPSTTDEGEGKDDVEGHRRFQRPDGDASRPQSTEDGRPTPVEDVSKPRPADDDKPDPVQNSRWS